MNHKEFEKRRRQLMRMVGHGGIVILPHPSERAVATLSTTIVRTVTSTT